MSGWNRLMGLMGLLSGLIIIYPALSLIAVQQQGNTNAAPTAEKVLATRLDGTYQLCTEPDPKDWQTGAGVCLNVVKRSSTVDGYYGYPHSDNFVCLQGRVTADQLSGRGLIVVWSGRTWLDVPEETFTWDEEGRLSLGQGRIIYREEQEDNHISWIIFEHAQLDMEGLYLYSDSRMTPPSQLCNWQFQGRMKAWSGYSDPQTEQSTD